MSNEEKPYSKFREFLIPDAKNTLEGASYRHSRGDFDGAEGLLNLAKDKIDRCIEQLHKDKQESQNEGED